MPQPSAFHRTYDEQLLATIQRRAEFQFDKRDYRALCAAVDSRLGEVDEPSETLLRANKVLFGWASAHYSTRCYLLRQRLAKAALGAAHTALIVLIGVLVGLEF